MSTKQLYPLMPKAIAVWLVDNTSLTFQQIAEFTGFHELEIKGIANGEVASGILGVDPITSGQLTKQELERCSKNPQAKIQLQRNDAYESIRNTSKRKTRYTMIARRQDKPDAIYWVLKNLPDIKDSTIIKLIGTTKATIESIRGRTHWNIRNIKQRDPVLLGICSQRDLNTVIEEIKEQETRDLETKKRNDALDAKKRNEDNSDHIQKETTTEA